MSLKKINLQNACVTFWDHSLKCVILPLDNALVYLMLSGCLVMSVNRIIGKLLVEMDVNHVIATQSDLFLNNVTRYANIYKIMSTFLFCKNNYILVRRAM